MADIAITAQCTVCNGYPADEGFAPFVAEDDSLTLRVHPCVLCLEKAQPKIESIEVQCGKCRKFLSYVRELRAGSNVVVFRVSASHPCNEESKRWDSFAGDWRAGK